MAANLLLLLLSIGVLVAGAELLVRGAGRLALRFGVSHFVIGVTVVGFGTSAPELAASIASATTGHPQIAIGNVIGSNIMNIALVLGVTAIIAPIPVDRGIVRRETVVMILVSFVPLAALATERTIGRLFGATMTAALLAFLWWSFTSSRRDGGHPAEDESIPTAPGRGVTSMLIDLAVMGAGLLLLVFGADRLVSSATEVARGLGVSEIVIGLTIVAGGTSAPELATSLIAVVRGKTDLGVGNILGSCIFNILGILGITAIVTPIEIPVEVFQFDLPVMILVAIATIPILFSGHRISRIEGVLLTSSFVLYTVMLFVGWPFPADRDSAGNSPTAVVEPEQARAGDEPIRPRID
ncbi:MAG: sodium:calcium antiporter [Phycisphaera sp.]|nr:sodium:calcium antiporter [Phycisphaera sp.]